MALKRFGDMAKNAVNKWQNKVTDSLVNDVKDLRNDEFKSQLNNARKKNDNLSLWDKYKRTGQKIDVPEFDAQIVDLPKEDENEKEIVVDRTPKAQPYSKTFTPNTEKYDLEALAGNGLPVEEEESLETPPASDDTIVGEPTFAEDTDDSTVEDTFDESLVKEPVDVEPPDIPSEEEINGTIEESKPQASSFYMPKTENEEWDLEDLAGNGQREEPRPESPKAEEPKPEEPKKEVEPKKEEPKKEEPSAKEKKKGEEENKDNKKKEEGDEEKEPKEKEKVKTDAADVKDNIDLVKKGSGVSVNDMVDRSQIPHYNYLSFFQ